METWHTGERTYLARRERLSCCCIRVVERDASGEKNRTPLLVMGEELITFSMEFTRILKTYVHVPDYLGVKEV